MRPLKGAVCLLFADSGGKYMELNDFFAAHPEVAVAFSGGVDSAYLLYAAKRAAKRLKAYYACSAFQPQFELEDAKRLAAELDVQMQILPLDVLADAQVTANPKNRCYYCKKRIFGAITAQARHDGFTVLLDGSNASDDAGDRPGMKALEELSVLSPLRLCGLTKAQIRALSKEAGLFTWDKPAYACLATRIPAGQPITAEALRRTEAAESYLFSLGFTDFRVRTVGDMAKLQLRAEQLPLLLAHREEIVKKLGSDYSSVCLDLEVRK